MPAAITRARMAPPQPNSNSSPNTYPRPTARTRTARTRRRDLTRLRVICSYKLRLHRDGAAGFLFGFEELPRDEAGEPGHDERRELLGDRVVLHDLVVVELPRERDLALGRGQLFLESQEVLVRLQVGVVLGHREQLPEVPRDVGLGGGLILHGAGGDGPGACLSDLLEQPPFVRGVSAHGLDQV